MSCSDYICELLEERSILERILGSASKRDRAEKEQKRVKLTELLEAIKNSQTEILAELELLRKDDAKVKLLSLTYKVFTTNQPPYLHHLISVQPPRITRSSSLVTFARPPTSSSLRITDRLALSLESTS